MEKQGKVVDDTTQYHQEEENWQAFHPDYLVRPDDDDEPPKKKPWKKILAIGGAVIAIIAMVLGLVMCSAPKEVSGTINGFNWYRSIDIEEYTTVQEEGWNLPAGGREISRQEIVHHYDQVLDHYENKTREERYIDHYEEYVTGYRDLGNGHFEEITAQRPVYKTRTVTYQEPVYTNVPVYETWYVYNIEKWVYKNKQTTCGNDKEP
jgi:hypothetical protein